MTQNADDLHGQDHVEAYVETDGDRGYIWRNGTHILLLTTKGRKSGEPRTTPLIHRVDGDAYVVVASKGGATEHPGWYSNLEEDPTAEVQVKADKFVVRARVAEGEERERLWKDMNEVWPDYEDYQSKTDREIPVVVLERG